MTGYAMGPNLATAAFGRFAILVRTLVRRELPPG